jgi:hypothetical protein
MAKPTVEEAQKELKFREKARANLEWLTALVIASLSNDDEARADYLRRKKIPTKSKCCLLY